MGMDNLISVVDNQLGLDNPTLDFPLPQPPPIGARTAIGTAIPLGQLLHSAPVHRIRIISSKQRHVSAGGGTPRSTRGRGRWERSALITQQSAGATPYSFSEVWNDS